MRFRLFTLLVLLLAGVARGDDPRELAREKFAAGKLEFDQQNYARALELLKESYALAPFPDLLFNIGRCHEELGHHREALDAYQHYLAVNPNDADVQRRAENMRRAALDDPEPSPEPLPPSPSPSLAPLAALTANAAPAGPTPVYRRWWLWTAVVGVTAVALGVGLGAGLSRPSPQRTFPPLGAP